MHYLWEFPLWLQGCSSIYMRVCEPVRERFKLILAELLLESLSSLSKTLFFALRWAAPLPRCASPDIQGNGWGSLCWLYLCRFYDLRTQTLASALPEDHSLWPCLESRERERSCAFECTQFMSKEDSAHKFCCLRKNGRLLPVSKRIQLNCRTMNLLI